MIVTTARFGPGTRAGAGASAPAPPQTDRDRSGAAWRPADDQQLRRRSRHPHLGQRLAPRRRAASVADARDHPPDAGGSDGHRERHDGPARVGGLRHHRAELDADQGRRARTTSSRWMARRQRCSPTPCAATSPSRAVPASSPRSRSKGKSSRRRRARQGERQLGEPEHQISDRAATSPPSAINGPITMTGIHSSSVDASTSTATSSTKAT